MYNGIIDVSHHNSVADFHQVHESGIKAIILKATQGLGITDPKFANYLGRARACGFLIGAYHFGTGENAEKQAAHFLGVCGTNILLALDCENNQGSSGDMTLEGAERFVTEIHRLTGVWPLFYSFQFWLNKHLGAKQSKTLANCPLWCARYGVHEPVCPRTWQTWSLWQYQDKASIPGILGNVDRSYLHAEEDHLEEFWAAHSRKAA